MYQDHHQRSTTLEATSGPEDFMNFVQNTAEKHHFHKSKKLQEQDTPPAYRLLVIQFIQSFQQQKKRIVIDLLVYKK